MTLWKQVCCIYTSDDFLTDINECEVDGYCSQLCENEVGSFQCSCLDGFTLEENGTCNALG